MNEETLRQRIALEKAQSAKERSEFMRWILLLAMNINRPTHSTLRFLLIRFTASLIFPNPRCARISNL